MRFSRRLAGSFGTAEHADHDATIVASPDRTVGRERIGPIALVAVDGWGRENRRCARMSQQPAKIVHARTAERFAAPAMKALLSLAPDPRD